MTQEKHEHKDHKEMREKLDEFKNFILSKYKFITAIGIIPPQAAEMFDEENELKEEERKEKPMHILVVLDDDKEKEFNEVKVEILKKFEKYVYSYVIGGSLVRGEAVKTSDVDIYIIIDDTDVKRMPRLELKEKLRNIIYSYVMQAGELAGVKNKLSPQVYLLTEFWEGVKDANPIFYTFLRDGVPIYDRGGFLPWKLLLKMGKIKPSPESIDMFMSMGDKTQDIAKRRMLDIVIGDIYYGVLTPSQALLMMYGLPPTNVRETVNEVRRIFVDKEKLLEKKYADILEEIAITYFKGYEHGKVKEVSGKEIDRLLKDSADYLKKLKEVREEIEKRMTKKVFEEIYENVFQILTNLFGKKSEVVLVREYEKEIVNQAKGNPRFIHTLNQLIAMKKQYKNGKGPSKYDFERLRKDSVYLIQETLEYGQRKELGLLQKTKVVVTAKGKPFDLFLTKPQFLVDEKGVRKIIGENIVASDANELNNVLSEYKGGRVVISKEILHTLEKEFGEFEISL